MSHYGEPTGYIPLKVNILGNFRLEIPSGPQVSSPGGSTQPTFRVEILKTEPSKLEISRQVPLYAYINNDIHSVNAFIDEANYEIRYLHGEAHADSILFAKIFPLIIGQPSRLRIDYTWHGMFSRRLDYVSENLVDDNLVLINADDIYSLFALFSKTGFTDQSRRIFKLFAYSMSSEVPTENKIFYCRLMIEQLIKLFGNNDSLNGELFKIYLKVMYPNIIKKDLKLLKQFVKYRNLFAHANENLPESKEELEQVFKFAFRVTVEMIRDYLKEEFKIPKQMLDKKLGIN